MIDMLPTKLLEEALKIELQNTAKELKVAEVQFNEARGLFLDAFSLKISYLKVLYDAILHEIKLLTDVYVKKGYRDRKDYLKSLSEESGVDYESVVSLANMSGPTEDFDGLVSAVENFDKEGD